MIYLENNNSNVVKISLEVDFESSCGLFCVCLWVSGLDDGYHFI